MLTSVSSRKFSRWLAEDVPPGPGKPPEKPPMPGHEPIEDPPRPDSPPEVPPQEPPPGMVARLEATITSYLVMPGGAGAAGTTAGREF